MKPELKTSLILVVIVIFNIGLRLIHINYAYIPSEEGLLIYGQKLAYSGLLPFIDYNAWNSLVNNYIIGIYQLFVSPTIMTQRYFGLSLALIVFGLVIIICQQLGKHHITIISALFLTFGSYTYLYESSIPYSSQTMTLFLVISLFFLATTLQNYRYKVLKIQLSLIFAVLATIIRIQALPALVIIWLFIVIEHRKRPLHVFRYTTIAGVTGLLIYLPFILRGWDNFIYSLTWPFWADKILVFQHQNTTITVTDVIRYVIDIFIQYDLYIPLLIAVLTVKVTRLKTILSPVSTKERKISQFILLSLLTAAGVALTSLLHKPPYSTYIYPVIPIFAYVVSYYLSEVIEPIISKNNSGIQVFLYGLLGILFLKNLILFPHANYLKTSLATIHTTPYSLLKEISSYIETKTSPNSEILAFYLPAVAEIDRTIPKQLNEGEGSISILSDADSRKYHLTNIKMLESYIASGKAEAIVMTNKTPNFFGINELEKQRIMNVIDQYYYQDKIFSNFSQIGNPRVSALYFYLLKK